MYVRTFDPSQLFMSVLDLSQPRCNAMLSDVFANIYSEYLSGGTDDKEAGARLAFPLRGKFDDLLASRYRMGKRRIRMYQASSNTRSHLRTSNAPPYRVVTERYSLRSARTAVPKVSRRKAWRFWRLQGMAKGTLKVTYNKQPIRSEYGARSNPLPAW
jgi:hypothetical protein